MVTSGVQAIAMARSGEFDLMILDIGLPELDGFTVLHALRSGSVDLPVLILTARDGIDDTVAGLRGGADDYMSKPFRFDELLARVQRRLRTPSQPVGANVLSHNGISLDLHTRRLHCDGNATDLTAQVLWRAVRARLLVCLGRADEAIALGQEAVRIAEATDFLTVRGDALPGELLRPPALEI